MWLLFSLSAALLLFNRSFAYAQNKQETGKVVARGTDAESASTIPIPPQGLQIGDKIPDELWDLPLQVVNHPNGKENITLNDYKGKLIILDFWATWCSPCIAMFPKTDSLQKQYGEEVQFLPVTYQDAEEVSKLFNSLTSLKGISPTAVVSDKTLRFVFPHKNLPHYVWISPKGTVSAITGMEEVKANAINDFLQTGKLDLTEKRDVIIPFDENQPLFIGGNGGDGGGKKNILYRAVLSGYVEGLPTKYTISPPTDERGWRILATNLPLLKLYAIAYGEGRRYFNRGNEVLEVSDTSQLISRKTGQAYREWMKDNVYCYEISVPPNVDRLSFKLMQEDLKRTFPQYEAKVEKRRTPCLLLVRTSKKDKLRSKGGETKVAFSPVGCTLQNTYLNRLTAQLRAYYMQHLSIPIVDETGYRQAVDLKLSANLSSVDEVRKALDEYDLDLVNGYREVEMLVIRDTNVETQP